MKNFLIKATLFILILFGIDVLLFSIAFHLCGTFPPEERALLENSLQTEGLILGTSHAEQGIIPSLLESETGLDWYNYGRARRNLVFNLYYSKALWGSGARPKAIVFVATYHDWNEKTHPFMIKNFIPKEQFFPIGLDFIKERSLLNPRKWLLSDQYSSTHRMMMSRSLSWLKNRSTALPFTPHPEDGFNGSARMIKPKPQPTSFNQYPWTVRPINLQAFTDTLDFWISKKVDIVVVDPPEFLGSRLSHQNYDTYLNSTKELCRERGVPYKSFSTPGTTIVDDPEYYRDGDWGHPNSHLNTKGATRFTKELALWLKQVLPQLKSLEIAAGPSTP